MQNWISFLIGVIVGGFIVFVFYRMQKKSTQQAAKDIENTFSTLSLEALRKNSEDFLKLANESLSKQSLVGTAELDNKKKLIDQSLDSVKENLSKVEKSITEFDSRREKSFGEITQQLKQTAEQTGKLQDTTAKLQTALANTRVRGQWGERMTEDVLRLVGFIEGVNYLKNQKQDTVSTRPDYTFLLPKGLRVNMDVKFPLDNYMKYLSEENEAVKNNLKQQFIKDTRQRIKEVTTRDYINPAENTVDYVLAFIPSEQIFCFINENDNDIMNDSLSNRVILCSPLTLYAMLAVIRQAVDNFNFEKTTSQISVLLREFLKQWELFKNVMDKMGKKIDETKEEYRKLDSTRSDKLERPLIQIEELRKQSGIIDPSLIEEDSTPDISSDE